MLSVDNKDIEIENRIRLEIIIEKALGDKDKKSASLEVARKAIADLLKLSIKEYSHDALKDLETEFNFINNDNPNLAILIDCALKLINNVIDITEFQEKSKPYFNKIEP